jgi:hypothetical protein
MTAAKRMVYESAQRRKNGIRGYARRLNRVRSRPLRGRPAGCERTLVHHGGFRRLGHTRKSA